MPLAEVGIEVESALIGACTGDDRLNRTSPRPELRETIEIGAIDGRDPRIAAGRLMIAHQDDRRAVAEDLDVSGHDEIRNKAQAPLLAKQAGWVVEPCAPSVELDDTRKTVSAKRRTAAGNRSAWMPQIMRMGPPPTWGVTAGTAAPRLPASACRLP